MANPAPIISQINAFNATEGTIISFNIVGGTSIVRSNIIYIYDLSDNSLICTHLYISTESIHELPANTDPSIAYASGKSSADFTNGKQYYAQIQTFTNTAGTEGASGASIAKLFWCLVDPTLTINTIPSSISTTSYNVGAVYNSNTTATSNIVQQYQFNLYSATGVLVQSSGVITGSGAQQGTSTVYDLSYNFTGLNVGSSYYVTIEATTTQGMTVSAQSNTFTVSIDTPTLGEATVVNNACDGYISVVSNLSDEYGGHVSGEIASFVTSSINDISSLKVTLNPIQDLHGYDHPWVGGAGKNLMENDEYTPPKDSNSHNVWVGDITGTYTFSIDKKQVTSVTYPDQAVGYVIVDGVVNYLLYSAGSITVTGNITTIRVFGSNAYARVNGTLGLQLELGSTATEWTPYENICPISGWDSVEAYVSPTQSKEDGTTHTATFEETVYGGTVDLVSGVLTVTHGYKVFDGSEVWKASINADRYYLSLDATTFPYKWSSSPDAVSNQYAYYGSAPNPSSVPDGMFYLFRSSSTTTIREIGVHDSTVGSLANLKARLGDNPLTVCYELATPLTIQLDPQTITTLVGVNNVWADSGDVSVTYNIPITKLLVKRQDTADISGKWLTLYSQPITQASDMDFTFIDFLNQYGKTYKYALVPLLTQEQSGVEVEVEGGYTVSDEVVSIFDGVFVADNTAIYKLKAGVNYGDLSKVQEVGNINTIGSKYPIIVSNSKVDYRTASLSATIVADDYYNNGNLNRMDMVQKRELMESFFTNKRAKILKDWNGNIWLVVFTDNINITFINEYGMGIATLTAAWTEIGDVTSEEDLQNTRIINVG